MDLSTPNNPTCLIVKQSKKKIFSSHIEKRIEGFMTYFNDYSPMKNISVITLEIDLDDTDEPAKSLLKVLHHEGMPNAIFVPNSRGFKLAEFIENNQLTPVFTLGYDLIDQNVAFLFINSWERVADTKKNASDFIKKNNYNFHVLLDDENKVIGDYDVSGIPTKFIIDKNGMIRFKSIGFEGSTEGLSDELSVMIEMIR